MKRAWIFWFLFVLAFVAVSSAAQVGEVIRAADAAFNPQEEGFDFEAYEGRLREAIAAYEAALPLLPEDAIQTRSYVLNRLAEACFELATAYLSDRDDEEKIFGAGTDYALTSLRLDPDFGRVEAESGFRAALRAAKDVAAIFWYGNNLGRYIEFHLLTALTGGMKDAEASFLRAIELDEAYLAGGPWRALGSYLAQVPAILGGDLERAGEAFRRAIELGPDYLENYLNYAEYYAKGKKDWTLFCQEVKTALTLAQDKSIMGRWPLYNALAVRRAEGLSLLEVEGKPVCPK